MLLISPLENWGVAAITITLLAPDYRNSFQEQLQLKDG